MRFPPRRLAALAACAVLAAPASAHAQSYASASPPPLYPYELQPGQPYAVQVAPNTYVIHRPGHTRDYPYVAPAAQPKRFDRPPRRNNPALIEELRRRSAKSAARKAAKKTVRTEIKGGMTREVINTTRIVRGPPVVIERKRYVDDPPQVIERYVTEAPDGTMQPAPEPAPPPMARRGKVRVEERGVLPPAPAKDGNKNGNKEVKRVIQADAEVTILGPDRMSIRLFRKGSGPKASASE